MREGKSRKKNFISVITFTLFTHRMQSKGDRRGKDHEAPRKKKGREEGGQIGHG